MRGFKKIYIFLACIFLSSALMGQIIRNGSTIFIEDGTFFVEGEYINEGSGNIEFNTSNTPIFEITGDLTNNASGKLILSAGTNGEMIFSGTGTQSIDGTSIAVFDFEQLTVSSGASVELTPGKYATVYGALSNNGTFTVQSDAPSTASLIAEGTVTGDLDIERYMQGSRFHIISSPVSDQQINTFITTNNIDPNNANTQYAMTDYNESINQWNVPFFPVSGTPTSNMTIAKGYLAGIVNAAPVTFTGSINTGNQSISIANTEDALAWNAIGNPYTSSINVSTIISANSGILMDSYEGLYVYNGINYVSVTGGSLSSGQGFFVKAETGGGTFGFTSSAQIHQSEGFYKKSLVSPFGQIKLFGSTEDEQDRAILRLYSSESTNGLDPGKDLGKFKGGVDFLIYSQLIEDNGVDFEIQALPTDHIESISVPIGMYYAEGGEVTFSVETLDLPPGTHVIFEDRQLDKFIDLEPPSASYTVDIQAETSGYGRFYLHTFDIQAVGVELTDLSNFNIFAKDKVVYLRGLIEHSGTAAVYDLMGKMHTKVQLDPGTEYEINLQYLKDGIYIIRLEDGTQFHSEKFLLK